MEGKEVYELGNNDQRTVVKEEDNKEIVIINKNKDPKRSKQKHRKIKKEADGQDEGDGDVNEEDDDQTTCKEKCYECIVPEPKSPDDKCFWVLCGIINIFFPGFGNMLLSCRTNNSADCGLGCGQFFAAFVPFGCIWAWVWGVLLIMNASKADR